MNCFYHPQVVAISICKNCNKGLCGDCATDVGNGVACKGKCEEEVLAINAIVNQSKTAYQKTGRVHVGLAILFMVFGALIIVGALLSEEGNSAGLIFGALFTIMGVMYFSYGRKIQKP